MTKKKVIPHSINLHIKCLSNVRCSTVDSFFHLGEVCLTVFFPSSRYPTAIFLLFFIERGKILIHFLAFARSLNKINAVGTNKFGSSFVC